MKKRTLLLICSIIIILLSSCAYQRYHSRNFKPTHTANGCKWASHPHSMKGYYKSK